MQRSNRELALLNRKSEHFRTQILQSHLASFRDFQNSQKEARIRKFMSGFNRNQTTTLSHSDLAYAKQLTWLKSEKEQIESVVDYLEKRTESTPSLSKTMTQSTSQKTIQTAQKSAKKLCNIPVRLLSPIRYKPKIPTEKEDSSPPRQKSPYYHIMRRLQKNKKVYKVPPSKSQERQRRSYDRDLQLFGIEDAKILGNYVSEISQSSKTSWSFSLGSRPNKNVGGFLPEPQRNFVRIQEIIKVKPNLIQIKRKFNK